MDTFSTPKNVVANGKPNFVSAVTYVRRDANEIADLVYRLADRLVGSVPTGETNNADPVAAGLFGDVEDDARSISNSLRSIESSIRRIENSLPSSN
jgi:hypothetical protein